MIEMSPMSGILQPERFLGTWLKTLGEDIRRHLIAHRDTKTDHLVVAQEGGDTIFAIDRKVEPVIEAAIGTLPDHFKPLRLVAEGAGSTGTKLFGDQREQTKYHLLVDPIDGTRGLMYDKRPAWFLAALARDSARTARLSDSCVSVMIEIPISKQVWSDSFVSIKGQKLIASRTRWDTNESIDLVVRPSTHPTLKHSFAQVSNFFPGTKLLAAELMEVIASETLGEVELQGAAIFDDQYISTGGQMVELMMGHDRFCCDLRPLFYDILERRSLRSVARGLECHPYDLAGLLAAKQAGVILTNGFGEELDAPFDVTTAMHWCGYANEQLRRTIQPVIQRWLSAKLAAD